MMLSTRASKEWLTVLILVLVYFAFFSLIPLAPPVVQGDSRTSSQPAVTNPQRPTVQSNGVNPGKGPPGSRITISGFGFRGFSSVESIVMGGIGILGNRTVATDNDGAFQIDGLIVPGLNPGIVGLTVRVGTGDLETTAVGTFEVTEPIESPSAVTPVQEALEPLDGVLELIFRFDNLTKTWSFFDPRAVFAGANDLTVIVEGEVYWIKVSRSVTVMLNAKQRDFTCSNEGTPQQDCWNLIVW